MQTIGVGMLGYGFMGRAHASAYRALAHLPVDVPLLPRLEVVCGRDAEAVAAAAPKLGFARHATDWRAVVEDPDVGLFDNGGPNGLHAEPTIAAARAGKHVIVEKPLGRDAEEAHAIRDAVAATGVVAMCAFNYRFVPAIRLMRELIEDGEIGELRHVRGAYLQDWLADPGAPETWRWKAGEAGSGAVGDLGSHLADLTRFLAGEIASVSATTRTFDDRRDVDDAFSAAIELESGAIGTLQATRVSTGQRNAMRLEVDGTKGSISFDLQRLNELQVSGRRVLVSGEGMPFGELWWPAGHVLGWEHSFVHELLHLLGAIAGEHEVAPLGATLEDGCRAAEVCDAILRSARTGAREPVLRR